MPTLEATKAKQAWMEAPTTKARADDIDRADMVQRQELRVGDVFVSSHNGLFRVHHILTAAGTTTLRGSSDNQHEIYPANSYVPRLFWLCADHDVERAHGNAIVVERVREGMMVGGGYGYGRTQSSHIGYRPPLNRADWAHCMKTLGEMAAVSDPLAQIAAGIVGKVNLYTTRPEAAAQVFAAANAVIADGYTDVIRLASPEPGRYKDAQRPYSLAERILVDMWLQLVTAKFSESVPGIGWCLDILAGTKRLGDQRERIKAKIDERNRW